MEDNRLKKGIEDIKNIKMTAIEKKQVFESILNTKVSKQRGIKSPWFTFSFIADIHKSRLAYYVIVPLLIILTGGGAVFASENSLPDSILYPIKVNVVEPVREALTFSKESKANYESNLAVKRMIEAETLVSLGKLDTEKEKTINNLLIKHNKKLNEVVDSIDQKESPEKVDRIVTNFQSEMNAHAKSLDDMIISKHINIEKKEKKIKINNNDQLNTENRDQPEVEQRVLKVPTDSEDDRENEISKSARWNAIEIGDKLKEKKYFNENKKYKESVDNQSNKFKERKDSR